MVGEGNVLGRHPGDSNMEEEWEAFVCSVRACACVRVHVCRRR